MKYYIFALWGIMLTFVFSMNAPAAQPKTYASLTDRISALSTSPYVRPIRYGRTVTGRHIPAYIIGDFTVSSVDKPRILLISGQHGDEINPINALVSFSENLVARAYPGILTDNLILCVPIVNPDGLYMGSRYNSLGKDINRCWLKRDTSENEFVHHLIKLFQPQIIVDAHEWFMVPNMPGNGIELAWSRNSNQRQGMSTVASKIDQVAGLKQIECRQEANRSLFHRRYSSFGYAAFLVETDPRLPKSKKESAYTRAFLTAIAEVNKSKQLRDSISPSAAIWDIDRIEKIVGSLRGTPEPLSRSSYVLWSIAPCVGCYLILMFFRPKKKARTTLRQWKLDRESIVQRQKILNNYTYRAK